jgi:hypothetical protein
MTRAEQLIAAVQQSGFPHLASLIHLFVGGSELHGAKVKDTDDLDIYGVYLEPPELALGLDKQDFYVWSTAGNERRNGPDDIDVCLYSLEVGGIGSKGKPHCVAFSILAELFTEARAMGTGFEEPGRAPVAAGSPTVPRVCRGSSSPSARDWNWQEGSEA